MVILYPIMVTAIYIMSTIASLTFLKKIQRRKESHIGLASIFLVAVLMLGIATLSASPPNIEATSLSDICERYGIGCDIQTPPEEETPPPEEEENTATTASLTTETVSGEWTRMIWKGSSETWSNKQRDMTTKLALDKGDQIVFHYGQGQDPVRHQINALKAVTSVADSNKGFEFFSLAEIREHAPTVAAAGFGFIAYDLENGPSPSTEVSNPTAAFSEAKRIADAAGIALQATPSFDITNGAHADDIAKLVDYYHIQSQRRQDDDTSCTAMRTFVDQRRVVLEGANPTLAGEISYQISLTSPAAPGKTIERTAIDCIDRVSPTGIDSVSIWWNTAAFDCREDRTGCAASNTPSYEKVVAHGENRTPANN